TRIATVQCWGNATATKRNLLGVAQTVATLLLNRVAVVIPTIFGWQSAIHLDMKQRMVAVVGKITHAPIMTALQNFVGFNPFPNIAWPDVHASEDVDEYLMGKNLGTNALPPGDTKSRGTFLEMIVAQGLSDPCSPQPVPDASPSAPANQTGDGQMPAM